MITAEAGAPEPASQHPAQLFLPVLLSKPSLAGSSPDVIARADDPAPALSQGLTAAEFAWRALRHRISLLEATTWDIEFNGD
jgi:hypothetical protein